MSATDYAQVNSAAVNPSGMTSRNSLGKFSDETINALKSGADPAFRLVCQNSSVPVTGFFPPGCQFAAHADASGVCTTVAYKYREPEMYGGQYTQFCVEGMADGDNSTSERLIYGADEAGCNNETTGCDTEYAHWSGIGSLWVR